MKTNFNKLPPNQKWKLWKQQKGYWFCSYCGIRLVDGPQRAAPFHGAEIVCEHCNNILTRRSGGGQFDPFEWTLKKGPG